MLYKQTEYIRLIEENPSLLQLTDDDSFGFTIFHKAALNDRLQIMEAINNIDPDMKDRVNNYNITPLMCSSNNGQVACVKWLLDHDVDVNIKNDNGHTALDYAKSQKVKKMIKEK